MTHDQADTATTKKVVRLPEPDAENITVLTHELPNDPILPWHRYDSPWLDADGKVMLLDAADAPAATEEIVEAAAEEVTDAQPPLLDQDRSEDVPEAPEAIALPDPDLDAGAADPSTHTSLDPTASEHLSPETDSCPGRHAD
ncbi:MAG: hypothetical protein EA367_17585 [Leptolyngbya sp. DLM2.Bin15]|nr:MAG: hypothetical protein EA367_17585 [Leptolyngbya sp. DLM2.Bin15]